jgi:hypothetical protein
VFWVPEGQDSSLPLIAWNDRTTKSSSSCEWEPELQALRVHAGIQQLEVRQRMGLASMANGQFFVTCPIVSYQDQGRQSIGRKPYKQRAASQSKGCLPEQALLFRASRI